MLYGNTWHTVCDAAFDQQDAEVVCRELDCGAPVQVLGAAAFDKGVDRRDSVQRGGNNHSIVPNIKGHTVPSRQLCGTDMFW